MQSEWETMIGHAIKIWTGGGGINAIHGMYFGILDGYDDYAILLRQPNEETLFLPRQSIRRVEPFGPDESKPEGQLLRAASEPIDDHSLLRPASNAPDVERDRLLHPAEDPQQPPER